MGTNKLTNFCRFSFSITPNVTFFTLCFNILKQRANCKWWRHSLTENSHSRLETGCALHPRGGMSISQLPEQPNPQCCCCRTPAVRSLAPLIQSRAVSRLKPECVPNVSAFISPSLHGGGARITCLLTAC